MAQGKTGLGGLQLTYHQNGSPSPAPQLSPAIHRYLTPRAGAGVCLQNLNFFTFMASYRTALLATAATALSLAATPAALANGLTFTNYTTTSGLGNNYVNGVYASGSNIYAATNGGLGISTNGGSSFTNKTTASGLGSNFVYGVYASGSNIYAATGGGLGISTNGGSSFTNYTTASGLGDNDVRGVYASGSNIYAATSGGLSIASEPNPVPGPLPVVGAAAAYGFSRKLRRRLRAAASSSPSC